MTTSWDAQLYAANTAHHRNHDADFLGALTLPPAPGCSTSAAEWAIHGPAGGARPASRCSASTPIPGWSRPPPPGTARRQLRFAVCPAQQLDRVVPADSADAVFSVAALHWVPKPTTPGCCGRCAGCCAGTGTPGRVRRQRPDRGGEGDPGRRVGPARRRPRGVVLPLAEQVPAAARRGRSRGPGRRLGPAAAPGPGVPAGRRGCSAGCARRPSRPTTRCCRPGRRRSSGPGSEERAVAELRRADGSVRHRFRASRPARAVLLTPGIPCLIKVSRKSITGNRLRHRRLVGSPVFVLRRIDAYRSPQIGGRSRDLSRGGTQ